MQHDEVPLPTNKKRRSSSIFESRNEEQNKIIKTNIPDEKSEIYYPLDYIDKVGSETEQWLMHISKILEENQRFKRKRTELQKTVVDENILSAEQHDFLATLNFDGYMRRAQDFCNRAVIFAQKIKYERESHMEALRVAAQNKIQKELFKEVD